MNACAKCQQRFTEGQAVIPTYRYVISSARGDVVRKTGRYIHVTCPTSKEKS